LEKRQRIIRDFAVKVSLGNLNYNPSYTYKDEFEDIFLSIKIMRNNLIKLIEESKIQQKNLETILNSLPFTILTIDNQNNIKFVNNEYGFSLDEIRKFLNFWDNGFFEDLLEHKDKKFKIISIETNLQNIKRLVIILDYTEIYEIEKLKIKVLRDLSHDLRTPLAIAKSIISNIKPFDSQTEEQINKSIAYLDKLTQLINRYLNFSKLKLRKIKPNFSKVSIEELVNLINDNSQLFSTNIVVNYPSNLVEKYTTIDIELFQQMLSNIIDNASKKADKVIVDFELSDNHFIVFIKNQAKMEDYILVNEILKKSKETKGLGLNIIREISVLNNTPIEVEYDNGLIIFKVFLHVSDSI